MLLNVCHCNNKKTLLSSFSKLFTCHHSRTSIVRGSFNFCIVGKNGTGPEKAKKKTKKTWVHTIVSQAVSAFGIALFGIWISFPPTAVTVWKERIIIIIIIYIECRNSNMLELVFQCGIGLFVKYSVFLFIFWVRNDTVDNFAFLLLLFLFGSMILPLSNLNQPLPSSFPQPWVSCISKNPLTYPIPSGAYEITKNSQKEWICRCVYIYCYL